MITDGVHEEGREGEVRPPGVEGPGGPLALFGDLRRPHVPLG